MIWADSWDYGTFRPPKTHSSNALAQPFSVARCLSFGRTLCLLPYFMCANTEGSGETARMRRLAVAFACRLYGKYNNLMSWLISRLAAFLALYTLYTIQVRFISFVPIDWLYIIEYPRANIYLCLCQEKPQYYYIQVGLAVAYITYAC